MITFDQVTKYYGETLGVNELDFSVQDGEFLVMLGPTGAGKTTTLNLISGVIKPSSGDIFFNDDLINPVSPRKRNVSFVFQDFILYPNMTVEENIAFPLHSPVRDFDEEEIMDRAHKVASTLSIDSHLKKHPPNLSGGEQQRVGIARALVRDPIIFLMDEPLSNLDAKIKENLSSELKRLQEVRGDTFFYVTHDQSLALSLADRLIVLRNGKIAQMGDPLSLYNDPNSVFVARFLTQPEVNLLPCSYDGNVCQLDGVSGSIGVSPEKHSLEAGSYLLCGFLPKDLELLTTEGDLESQTNGEISLHEAQVRQVRFLGADQVVTVDVDQASLDVIVSPGTNLAVGDTVQIKWNTKDAFFFDDATGERVG
ncbi:MAG: ABC transporter ATP-binding protein [Candidatus Bipolaricaulota bacterium]|nr:ABC transporter ATP-binding protein [Candidatus Bipolaricaulota bacterium]